MFELLWPLVQPSNLLVLVGLTGLVLRLIGLRRTGAGIMILAGLVLLAFSTLPIAGSLMVKLETRFPQPDLPDHVDGIIVLGGAVDPRGTERWGQPQLTARVERLTEGATLARQYPDAKLVFTGGSWNSKDKLSEADVARAFFAQLGIPEDRLVFEDSSTSTHENALYTKQLLAPEEDEVWLLVTSAYHIPRAMGVFRKAEWEVIPYPVDYYTKGEVQLFNVPHVGSALSFLDFVAREWTALGGYYLEGRSDTFFPGPETDPEPEESDQTTPEDGTIASDSGSETQ